MVHDENHQKEKKKLEFLSDIHVAEILLNSFGDKENYDLYKNLYKQGLKIVCWDRKINDLIFDSKTIDHKQASF